MSEHELQAEIDRLRGVLSAIVERDRRSLWRTADNHPDGQPGDSHIPALTHAARPIQ